jgi:signal transduction histidine kinase
MSDHGERASGRSTGNEPMQRSVMLIDDDADARALVGMTLRDRGYDVVECSDGLDALEQLRGACKPDVIVLDLRMPVMDGWQFRVEQKGDPALAGIPVIALSGDSSSKAAAIDAEAYLAKPVDPATVVATVDRLTLELDRRALDAHLAQVSRLSSLGTLAAGMAHEINNPLTYVLLNVTFLEQDLPRLLSGQSHPQGGPRILEALAQVRHGTERVRDIVHGLKTFARPELEARGPVDVLATVEASIAMVAHEIRCRATLRKTVDAGLPPVFGNAARLGQVFLNLLLNAVQALADDDPARNEILVVLAHDARGVLIEVHDTGAGIAPEIRGRIFEPFFTTKPVGSGTGLGLAICHGIVTAHGGTLSVDSEPGKGSCFRVRLPSMHAVERSLQPAGFQRAEKPARVLVVDDEPNIGTSVRHLLLPEHRLETTTEAREALSRIRSGERYDLVLCDVMMPVMDGQALYEAVLDCAPEQARRMAFVTGGAFTERAQRFLTSVPNPHLEKPFTIEQLLEILRAMRSSSQAG